jgi:hypothetical protein
MRTRQIRVGQSLRQVQQFLDAHAGVVGPANESEARQSLNAAVTQLDASATEQGTRTRERHGEVTRREQLEQQLVRKFMTRWPSSRARGCRVNPTWRRSRRLGARCNASDSCSRRGR